MSDVLPADSYTEVTDQYTGGDPTVLNVYDAGEAGYVVQVKPATSFSGNLTVMVGVGADGACTGISITSSGETSGLGSNASKPAFADQFVGKDRRGQGDQGRRRDQRHHRLHHHLPRRVRGRYQRHSRRGQHGLRR